MPHRIFALDLGAHAAKFVELSSGFRNTTLVRLEVTDLIPDPGDPLVRSVQAISEVLQRDKIVAFDPADVVVVALPGDRVVIRDYPIPFSDSKRLQAVVSNELADDLPWPIDEVTFDYKSIQQDHRQHVLVTSAPAANVATLLEQLSAIGLEPRQLIPAPFAYGSLVGHLYPDATRWVVDFGHLRTNVALVHQGRTLAGRTILWGGHQLTMSLRSKFHLSYTQAEIIKHEQGCVVAPERATDGTNAIAEILHQAVLPMARELRDIFETANSHAKLQPDKVHLCGGTSRLLGFPQLLSELWEIPVEPLSIKNHVDFQSAGLNEEGEALGSLAIGCALEQGHRHTFNLRQGRFAYKRAQSVFRDKLIPLVASVLLMLIFAAGGVSSTLYALRREQAQLQEQLAAATKQIFGEPVTDAQSVLKTLRATTSEEGGSVPEKSALDVLTLVSTTLPANGEAKLDISRLDIRPGKTELSGMADSQSTVGAIVEKFRNEECISEVSTGKVTEVSGGGKQFSLTLQTNCF